MYIKKGFTLAEVLITLGIVGIVAALTIPVLMQNIQNWQFKEAAKSAFSKASQSIQLMKNDTGGTLSGYYSDSASFYNDYRKFVKIAQDCTTRCVTATGTSDVYDTLLGDQAQTWLMASQFITPDGMFWGLYNNETGAIYIVVDVNGYIKKPNAYGIDTFIFQLIGDNLLPLGAKGTNYGTWPATYCNRTDHNSLQGYTCMFYLTQSKDY